MNDFKTIAKILSAVLIAEDTGNFDCKMVSPEVLGESKQKIDILASQLQYDGYVSGLCIIDGIDNQEYPVVSWGHSKPMLTIKGREFIEENKPLNKAIKELKDMAISVAGQAITNQLMKM